MGRLPAGGYRRPAPPLGPPPSRRVSHCVSSPAGSGEPCRAGRFGPAPSWLAPGSAARQPSPPPVTGQGANRQIRSLVLYVDLVGSRRIWPAHVGWVVDPDGSRRVPSDRLDDQPDDQASDAASGHAARFMENQGEPEPLSPWVGRGACAPVLHTGRPCFLASTPLWGCSLVVPPNPLD
jgi:hypothetical protein